MTKANYNQKEKMMLDACKHYIRITNINEEEFVSELIGLAEQYCTNLSTELISDHSMAANK